MNDALTRAGFDSSGQSVVFDGRTGEQFARKVTVVRKTANAAQLAEVRAQLAAGADLSSVDYLNLVQVDDLEIGSAEPLKLQIDDFLDAVRTGRHPMVDAQAGFAAVRTAERIVDSARAAGARMV